ncbi:MAG: Acetyltransferase domain, partial [Solirubrobacteraceae bacterium]|nr:Acetyltransferase domain [Solirubrobacteraceae bacterium]
MSLADDAPGRGRAWRHAAHAAICDVIQTWAHGTVVRATRYPDLHSFNVVRVENHPRIGVGELVSFSEEALVAADSPDQPSEYLTEARDVAARRGARVLAVRDGDMDVGFVELERVGSGAEITLVYVLPDHRGRGLGAALV